MYPQFEKANIKFSAFSRFLNCLDEKQSLILCNSFIKSQLNYCPLIWMFCGNVANKDLNRIHKRALRILQNDYSSFEELLRKSNECTIRANNLQKLMLEVYKNINKKPSFMWNMFHEKSSQYDLRSKNLLILPQTNTIRHGNDRLIFPGSILWNYFQNDIKSKTPVCSFKKCMKSRSREDCNCK